jgi:hypothetical protein
MDHGGIIDEALHLGSEAIETVGHAVTNVVEEATHWIQSETASALNALQQLGRAHVELDALDVAGDIAAVKAGIEASILQLARHIGAA